LYEKTGALLGFNGSEFTKQTTAALLRGTCKPVIVDVGCNVGDFVTEILTVDAEAMFFCFDINSECEVVLRKAHPNANIQFFNLGLSDRSGYSTFSSRDSLDRKAHLNDDRQDLSQGGGLAKIKITTLDEALSNFDAFGIDILKIDTEGTDFKVLLGSKETLDKTQVVVFEIMYRLLINGNLPQEILEFLRLKNFRHFYRLTKRFGLQPLQTISPWQIATQNIIASKVKLM